MKINEIQDELFKAFTDSDVVTLLETARLALSDAGTFEAVATKTDSDEGYLGALRERLEAFMDN